MKLIKQFPLVLVLGLLLPALAVGASETAPGVAGADRAVARFGPSHAVRQGQGYDLSPDKGLVSPYLALDSRSSPAAAVEWHSYPIYGGEMISIAMDPADAQTVYVGTRDAGVFKTTDGARSWVSARQGLTFMPIRSLQVAPQHPNILYAGTDFDGVWKSTDGGATWFKSSSGLDESMIIFSIVIDPQDTNIVYAGMAGGLGWGKGNIFKSEDGGATWVRKDHGIPPGHYGAPYTSGIFSLAIDPNDPTLLYAGTRCAGAFESADGGETWTAINEGLPLAYPDCWKTVNSFAVDLHHSGQLGAIVGGDYYRFESGQWHKVSQSTFPNDPLGPGHLYFHASVPTVTYSAGTWFSKSTDGCVNWTQYLGWADSGDVPEIAFHPSSLDTLYAASRNESMYVGGVYTSTDQGEIWAEASQGITAAIIRSVAIDPRNSNYIYAGNGDGHFYRTLDGGATWYRHYDIDHSISDVAVDPLDSSIIYAANQLHLYRSSDQGESFYRVNDVEWAWCIAIPPHASNPVYVGTAYFGNGIYRSMDSGITWTQLDQGPTSPILSLAIDPSDPATLWAGRDPGIFRSTDGGDHWQAMSLTNETVEAIAVHPGDSHTVLVGSIPYNWFEGGRIFKSTDGGNSWQLKLSGIAYVQDIVFDPRDPSFVYAATEGYGVLRSFDGGETWHNYSNGIFYPVLYSLAITADDPPLMVVGSYSSGLYWTHPSLQVYRIYLPFVARSPGGHP